MTLSPFQFPLYRLPDEVGSFLAVLKSGVDSLQSPLREACRHLLVVYLFSTHAKIYQISPKLTSPSECDII
jgi:hypothetical protein